MQRNIAFYLKLFQSTFYLSAFTFGGGYVIVPLMKKKFVDELSWIEEKEMLDMVAIAQSAPGIIAVNTSILIGYKLAGLLGSLVTILGTVLPPLIIISIISMFYEAFRDSTLVGMLMLGMQAGVSAVIADVVWSMSQKIIKQKSVFSLFILIGSFIATVLLDFHILFVFLIAASCGILHLFYTKNKESEEV